MSLTLKGIGPGGFGGYGLTDTLLRNIKYWLDWGLLHQGAFETIPLAASSYLNPEEARLRPVPDERYEYGRVWHGLGKEWVWEQGVAVPDAPFRVSGVYIDGGFHPVLETGPYAHHIDYQNGRIIFDQPQDPNADLRAEYCHRMVLVTSADHPHFRALLQRSIAEFETGTEPSGTPAREHQIWLPSIFIDIPQGRQRGLELGGGQIKTRDVSLYVFADDVNDRNLLADWMDMQSRSAFVMADLNQMRMPFDEYGGMASGITNWPDMVTQYPWKKLRVMDGQVRKLDSLNPNIFRARITWTVEVDYAGI